MSTRSTTHRAATNATIPGERDEDLLLIDAHVHFYECFDLDRFLTAAAANFAREFERQRGRGRYHGLLLLTESFGDHWFERLCRRADGDEPPSGGESAWSFARTSEGCSLVAHGPEGQTLVLVAGRQIVTGEDLEVLALGTDSRFQDGAPLEAVVELARDADAFPVIPWGFGKWLGNRGRVLTDFLARSSGDELMLGDNSGRPVFWRSPFHFSIARRRGIHILPGSDPLPFPRECERVASFGSSAPAPFDLEKPADRVKQLLRDGLRTRPYGDLETPLRFARNQIEMQLKKRLRKSDH